MFPLTILLVAQKIQTLIGKNPLGAILRGFRIYNVSVSATGTALCAVTLAAKTATETPVAVLLLYFGIF